METERAVVVFFFYSAGNNSLMLNMGPNYNNNSLMLNMGPNYNNNSLMLNMGPNYNQSVHHSLVHKDVLTVFMLTQYLIFVIFVSLGWHFHAK